MSIWRALWSVIRDIGAYLLHRATEPSTYKGLFTMLAAVGGWKATQQLDLTSPVLLEAATWGGLFIAGLINAVLPQSKLYRANGGSQS